MSLRLFDDAALAMRAYQSWLDAQPLAPNTRLAYCHSVKGYCTYLLNLPQKAGSTDPLTNENNRDWAVRDYKLYLKTTLLAKPSSGWREDRGKNKPQWAGLNPGNLFNIIKQISFSTRHIQHGGIN